MTLSDETLRKHLDVAVQAMSASLNSFPLTHSQANQGGQFSLTLEAPEGFTVNAMVYSCPDPTDPTGKKHIIQNTPCLGD